MKGKSPNSVKQGQGRFAIIPEHVMRSDAYQSLSKAELRVYGALALHADKERQCWPSIETLADVAGVDVRTVEKSISKMTVQGLLAKQVGGGRKRTNKYRLLDDPNGIDRTDADKKNPGQSAGVSADSNPGELAGVSSQNPGENPPKPRPPRRGNIEQQTCMHGDEGSARVLGLRAVLSNAGVAGLNLDRLAARDDLTVDDVEALYAVAHEKAARNPAGMLVTMIDSGQRPSAVTAPANDDKPDATNPSRQEDVEAIFAALTGSGDDKETT